MAFLKKYVHQMSEKEKEQMKKWGAREQREWRDWLLQENYRRQERYAITNHRQPCECSDCRVYRQRVRIRCQRPIKRKPRDK